jgi:hypothetical protein
MVQRRVWEPSARGSSLSEDQGLLTAAWSQLGTMKRSESGVDPSELLCQELNPRDDLGRPFAL